MKIVLQDCTPDYCAAANQQTTIPCVRAIVLICDEDILKKQSFDDARGVVIAGPSIPGKRESLINRLDSLFINKALSKDSILNIKHEIISYYKQNHRPVIAVNVPQPQSTRFLLYGKVSRCCLRDQGVVR